ncbi:MAG: hypothetical protein KA195_00255 [Burkholderiaceae bacterium]|nr:hypothetical protein [Burkholderiaceae bacterium]
MQNTYLGQTAGGIIKTAQIAQMRAENWEIVVRASDGAEHVAIAGNNVLTLLQVHGVTAQLPMSARAAKKMQSLTDAIEARYLAA